MRFRRLLELDDIIAIIRFDKIFIIDQRSQQNRFI